MSKAPKKSAHAPVPSPAPAIGRLTLSRREAAQSLGLDIQSVDALILSKRLRASKVGRRVLIHVSALESMLEDHAIT